jgi:hypothetical protein
MAEWRKVGNQMRPEAEGQNKMMMQRVMTTKQ